MSDRTGCGDFAFAALKWYLLVASASFFFFAYAVLWETRDQGFAADFASLESKLNCWLPTELKRLENLGPIHWSTTTRRMMGATWILSADGIVEPSKFFEWADVSNQASGRQFHPNDDRDDRLQPAPTRFPTFLFRGEPWGRYWGVRYRDERTRLWVRINYDSQTGVFFAVMHND